MEPSTPPPKRRRRRRLIVAFVLALMSLVSWWYWPRGDARFVGKWEQRISGEGFGPDYVIVTTLQSNGRGRFDYPSGRYSFHFPWTVQGDRFVIGRQSTGPATAAFRSLAEIYFALTGKEFLIGEEETYDILSVGESEIQLKSEDGQNSALTRIPE